MKNWTIKQILLGLVCLMFVGVATATSINSKYPVETGASFAMAAGVAAVAIGEKEIAEAKAKYGPVKLLTVVVEPPTFDGDGKMVDKGEKHEFLVRRPDKNDIKIMTHLGKNDNIDEFIDYAQKNLIVGGDVGALEDGIVYTGFMTQVKEMIQPAASFLKKV
jgi:hypothetical protein